MTSHSPHACITFASVSGPLGGWESTSYVPAAGDHYLEPCTNPILKVISIADSDICIELPLRFVQARQLGPASSEASR
jgi:hypothetical protein